MRIFLFLFVFTSNLVFALEGRILERGTRKPLRDVNVYLLPEKLKAVTDAQGKFSFADTPSGECQLIVNLTGYQKLDERFPCDEKLPEVLYLRRQNYNVFETKVRGKVKKRDDQAYRLSQDEFIKLPGSFGGDPIRATQNLPGVANNGANAQIVIQGASPDDTGYLIDGHRVPLVFHFGGLSSVITPEAVESVDLLPAGYGPEYSRAIGGLIGLNSRSPKKDRLHGLAFVDILNAGLLLEGPIDDKSRFLISGRYSYVGQVLKAVAMENDDFELTAAPTYYDVTGIYERDLSESSTLKTTAIASKDQLELILNRSANNDTDLRGNFFNSTEFYRIIPQLSTKLSGQTEMTHSLGFGHDSLFVDIGNRYLDVDATVISQRSEVKHKWSKLSTTYVGLDNYWQDTQVKINLPAVSSIGGVSSPFSVGEERKFTDEASQTFLGVYLRQEIKPSEDSKWTLLPNLRLDHFTINQETHLQPRFQARYQLEPKLLLRGSAGQYYQTPLPQESSRLYGNDDLRSPYAWHYTLGFTKDFRGDSQQGFLLTNNYFYKKLEDLVTPDVSKNYSNAASGEIVGGEIQGRYQKEEWSGQVVYTYLRSRRTIPGFGTTPSEFDQTHNLNFIGALTKELWTFSARFRFVTGNPYTPINGASFDSDNDVYIPSRGSLYSQRFENFNQLDVRAERKFIYDTWILTAYVDILNLYNASNSQNFEYSYDYETKKKVRGLPILPTIGLKGEF